jgi:Phosphotransferase enzyme family
MQHDHYAAPERFPVREIAHAVGAEPLTFDPVQSRGFGRVCGYLRVLLADGRRVFVKNALTDDAAESLRKERVIYESVSGSFMPEYVGAYDDSGTTLLAIEDLTSADWPPPWSAQRIDAVLASLDSLHATMPPPEVESLEKERESITGWGLVAADPEPLLATGLCSSGWLDGALSALVRASEDAELGGGNLIHLDVRSDNLCFVDHRAVLVDWNLARVGNGRFDVAFWLPSLQLEGGPEPSDVLPSAGTLAAAVAGFFAVRAGLPPPFGAPTVRVFQLAQATVALAWAARELSLPPPS